MKNAFALLALAASLGQVAATFHGANPFTCPDNTDNKCDDKQKGGFSWGDLNPGKFGNYGGFNFNGWTCEDKFSKRDELSARTFGNKVIEGSCSSDKKKSPSFGADSGKGVDKFSIVHFDLTTEFDCDLEFHYDMPDGSNCKHRSRCSKSGSTIKNTQCGGAKNVTVVYPPQPDKPKTTCGVGIHTISFDCETPKPPKTPKTTSTKPATSTTFATTTSTSVAETTSTTSTTTTSEVKSTSTTTTTSAAETTSTTTTTPQETETKPPKPEETTSSVEALTSSTSSVPETTSTEITSYFTTSTIFTTIVSTVTSCAASVPNCPGQSTVLTTVTIPLTTTICPVTETITHTPKPPKPEESTKPPKPEESSKPPKPEESTPVVTSSAIAIPSSTKPTGPLETLPCPGVLPSCLNTWIFSLGCSSNTDTACYCPDTLFVENIFTCIYAHGETDDIISQAVVFFQGICAPHAPENPAIVTGAETVTKVITVTAAPTVPAAVYTTVILTATTVVPCETNGSIIPGSSITKTIQTTISVPQVGFATDSSDAVVPVPVTSISIIAPPPAVPTVPTTTTSTVIGTGGLTPTPTQTRVFVTGAASKGQVQAGMGIGLAVLAAVAAF